MLGTWRSLSVDAAESKGAADYDGFRDRMLHGRQELVFDLPAEDGAVWVELGAGTGRNLDFLGDLERAPRVSSRELSCDERRSGVRAHSVPAGRARAVLSLHRFTLIDQFLAPSS
jgi:hypothetical protein